VVSLRGLLLAGAVTGIVMALGGTGLAAAADDDPPISEVEIPIGAVDAFIAAPASAQRPKSLEVCKWWQTEALSKSDSPHETRFAVRVSQGRQSEVTFFDEEGQKLGTNTLPASGAGKTEVAGFVRCRVLTTDPQKA
jgi:hypothetical protein